MNIRSVLPFLRANLVVNADARITADDLYSAYLDWFPYVVEAGEPTKRRTFTGEVRAVMQPYSQIRYGPHLIDGIVSRGFVGLQLAKPGHDGVPAGPHATARDLLKASRLPEGDIEKICDLLITADSVKWSRVTALAMLDEYVDGYPEVGQISELIQLRGV